VPLPGAPKSYPPTDSHRGLGFLFFEMEYGKCTTSLGEDLVGTLLDMDFLGGDWRGPRLLGIMGINLSLFIFGFTFFAYLRPVRYAVYAFCLFILVVFQSIIFAVITSEFCGDADCKLGRGAGFSIASVFCFFFSGILFVVTGDHPGDEDEDAEASAATGKGAYEEASLADTEEPTVERVEDDLPTEQVVNEQVLNDGFFDVQDIEVLSDPFVVRSTAVSFKAVPAAVLCFFFSGLLFGVTGDHSRDEDTEAASATGKGAYEEASLADTEELTVEHVVDDLPTEQVVNDGFFDVQDIEALSDPFVLRVSFMAVPE
jgi:hypothetical protein